jgi:GNAT superfamily N-acetyltransferase
MLDDGLDWLEDQARQRGRTSIEVVALQGGERRVVTLSRRSFVVSERGNVRFSRQLESLPDAIAAPTGFSLRHVSAELDVERRVFVETASFGSLTPTADTWRLLMRRLPNYRRELDLIAVAPDGGGASACSCWYDEATRCGEFEAVGTSPACQRRGIGTAVIIEGLRRLHRLGATQAVVETTIGNVPAIALYRSSGFEFVADDHGWTKQL